MGGGEGVGSIHTGMGSDQRSLSFALLFLLLFVVAVIVAAVAVGDWGLCVWWCLRRVLWLRFVSLKDVTLGQGVCVAVVAVVAVRVVAAVAAGEDHFCCCVPRW